MNTPDFKRKLTAVFSADVAGYSRLMGEDEAATVKTLEAYKQVMFSLIKQHRGRVIDSPGDNLLAEFASVVDAVQCGVAVQKELQARNADLPENRKMQFRIGINLGDVIEEQDRIYGDGVNIAARLESCADPGGICVSKTAFDHIETKLPLGYEYLGEKEVKNIAKPVGAYRVLMDPRVTVAGAKEKVPKVPLWRHTTVLTGVIVVLLAMIGVGVWNSYFRAPPIEPASKEKMALPLPDLPSIAVLPFTNMSEDPKQEFLSDAITENIITALSKVPRLFVIARNSTFSYKGKGVKVKQVAEELGVQYVLEGSIQRSADRLRITAQLIDALKGHHLWAERYDRDLTDLFVLQDEITLKILAAIQVKLTEGETYRAVAYAGGKQGLDCYLKAMEALGHVQRANIEDNNVARRIAEEAIAMCPEPQKPYSLMASIHMMDYWFGTSKSPRESIEKAIELAQKALAVDDSRAEVHALLSQLYCLRKEWDKAIAEGERGVTLNPSGADVKYWYAATLTFAGRTDEAILLFEKAIRLNPFGPSRYFLSYGHALRVAGRFEEAASAYKKAIQREPNNFFAHLNLAGTYSLLGLEKEARAEAAEVLRLNPKFSLEMWAKVSAFRDRSETEKQITALRKAGLPEKPPLPLPDKPSIAVLPFVNMSDDKSQEFFSDGLTEEIITALSKTPKLFVIARNSTFVYKGKPVNVQQVSRELGVKYVLEGSVRKSGDQLRITAQLIDATTGNHLWAERYDREMKDTFAIQDEITMKIVTSFIELTESQAFQPRGKYPSNLQAYLRYLEGAGHFYANKFGDAMKSFEEALRLDPNFPPTFFWMAWVNIMNVLYGPSATRGRSLEKAFEFAEKAKALDDKYWGGPSALGTAYLLKRDYDKALFEGKLSTELAPNSSGAATFYGWTLRSVGRYEEALKECERALRIDPLNFYPMFHMGSTYLMMRRFDESIAVCKKAVERNPRSVATHIVLAMAYSSLGKMEEAHEAASQVLKLNPNFSLEDFAKAQPNKHEEDRVFGMDALRKAGLK